MKQTADGGAGDGITGQSAASGKWQISAAVVSIIVNIHLVASLKRGPDVITAGSSYKMRARWKPYVVHVPLPLSGLNFGGCREEQARVLGGRDATPIAVLAHAFPSTYSDGQQMDAGGWVNREREVIEYFKKSVLSLVPHSLCPLSAS